MKKLNSRMALGALLCLLCCMLLPMKTFALSQEMEAPVVTSDAPVSESESVAESAGEESDPEPETEPGEPLSAETDLVTRDLLYDEATNKQFITIEDRDGNVFYIIIDYDAPVNEEEEQYKAYFLNPVDISDMMALTDEEEPEPEPEVCTCKDRCTVGAINTLCPICTTNMNACIGEIPEPDEDTEEDKSFEMSPVVPLVLLVLILDGGILGYFKLVKPKPQTKGNDDLGEYDYGEDDDPPEYGEIPEITEHDEYDE